MSCDERIDIILNNTDIQYFSILAKRISEGDSTAFTELHEATCEATYRYAYYFLKDSQLAQDAVQEIYVSVYKNISSLKHDTLLIPWMRQITYRVCCDFARKIKRSREDLTDFARSTWINNLVTADNCTSYVCEKDFFEQLEKLLCELPEPVYFAFLLRFENGLKLEEIADFMNCSLSSVKRYLKLAKKHLQENLDRL